MKKLIKICVINFVFIIIILLSFEFGCAFISFNHDKTKHTSLAEKIKKTVKYSIIHYKSPLKQNYAERVRSVNIYEKDSILLLGCSFTYGDGLTDEQSFHSVLSKYTDMNVINLGICCASPREMLYILRDDDTRNSLLNNLKNVNYVIYTYIPDQKRRLYIDVCQFKYTPSFKKDNKFSELKYYKKNRVKALSFAYNYINAFFYDKFLKNSEKSQNLLFLYFYQIQKEINKHYTGSAGQTPKFIILIYEDDNTLNWNLLNQQNITLINANRLINKDLSLDEYKTSNYHPNAKVWRLIVPELIKASGINQALPNQQQHSAEI